MYSREAYLAIKEETTENSYQKPTVFLPLLKADVPVNYKANPSQTVIGDRTLNIKPIKDLIEAPTGSITVSVEPKTFGYLLKGVFGALNSGNLIKISSPSASFTVGETITGGNSGATATVVSYSYEGDYMILSSVSGTFTAGETITGGTSSSTATVSSFSSSVYAHEAKAPQSSLPTFTMEIGYQNEAYRFGGVRFTSISSITHQDNMIVAEIGVMARSAFTMGRVTAITTSGSGSKTITVDQTTGLLTSDTIKVFRPSTGAFLDFSASGVKTHSIDSVASETSFTVTNLETSLAVGDLIVLAPQTASYTLGTNFVWVGGSEVKIADSITSAISASGTCIEEFDFAIENETEPRYCANGTDLVDRFASSVLLKKFSGNGSFKRAYTDQTFLDKVRSSRTTGIQVYHQGDEIVSGLYNSFEIRVANAIFAPYSLPIEEDKIIDDDLKFDMYKGENEGYTTKGLLINDVSSY